MKSGLQSKPMRGGAKAWALIFLSLRLSNDSPKSNFFIRVMTLQSSKRSYLGIDIGSTSVKLVELKAAGRIPELATYALAELSQPLPSDPEAEAKLLGRVIAAAAARAHVRTRLAMAAVPTNLVFTSIINIPKVARSEVPLAIEREAKKILPLPFESMRLESKILDGAGPAGETRVLLTGAATTVVERHQKIFSHTHFTLLSLEPEIFSLIRGLIGHDPTPSMVIDLGAVSTDIFVVDGTVPMMHRSLANGGTTVTDLMATKLGLPTPAAEQFKRDLSLAALSDASSVTPQAITASLAPIVSEVTYPASLFAEQSGKRVEKVILSGGSSLLPGLASELSRVLNLRVYVGNPWARVRYPLELKAMLEESSGRYAVAVGLAMRDVVR